MKIGSTDKPSGLPPGPDGLGNIPVLIVDCQGDGNRLVEIAWSVGSASGGWPPAKRFLVEGDGGLSAVFQRLTGISDEDLSSASPAEEAADALIRDLSRARLVVAHACRYESRLLATLPGVPGALPPDGLVCSAELAKRLLPGLSGFGLRAVCGYLGLRVGALRNASEHVEVTGLVWQRLLGMMDESQSTLSGLLSLLGSKAPSPAERLDRLPAGWRDRLPDRPGVYRLLDFSGKDLYVGKAASLRRRVPQHFHPACWRSKGGMGSAVCDIAVEVCETELEAALLEAGMIQEARPSCNRALSGPPPEVGWFSRDLARCAPSKGRGFPLGPHLARGPLRDLGYLGDALRSGEAPILADACKWLGSFEPGSFEVGFGLFRAAHPECSSGDPGSLLRLASDIEAPGGDPGSQDGEEPEPVRVLRALESVVAAAGCSVRRAKWYGMLACSVLRWEAFGKTRELALCSGEVRGVRWLSAGDPPRPHDGDCRGAGSIGPGDLRRLSILTGELRRLVRKQAGVTMIPGRASRALDRDRLAGILERL